jgi:hypothetical protein
LPAAIEAVDRMASARWAEGTGPRLPCPGAGGRTDERICCKLIEQWWLDARWTMNPSRLRSNKEESSELQETNVFEIAQSRLIDT